MSGLHFVVAWLVIAATGLTGLWAGVAHWRPSLRSDALVWAVYASWVLTVAQVTLGVVVLQSGVEADQLHYFYGFLAMAAIAIIYSYRQQIEKWEYLLLEGGNLFIMGLALRAVFL